MSWPQRQRLIVTRDIAEMQKTQELPGLHVEDVSVSAILLEHYPLHRFWKANIRTRST